LSSNTKVSASGFAFFAFKTASTSSEILEHSENLLGIGISFMSLGLSFGKTSLPKFENENLAYQDITLEFTMPKIIFKRETSPKFGLNGVMLCP
jgi:hypothetical protein